MPFRMQKLLLINKWKSKKVRLLDKRLISFYQRAYFINKKNRVDFDFPLRF